MLDSEMNHGHVRWSNAVARCGGPGICSTCKLEFEKYGLIEFIKLKNRSSRAQDQLETLLSKVRYLEPPILYELAGSALTILRS